MATRDGTRTDSRGTGAELVRVAWECPSGEGQPSHGGPRGELGGGSQRRHGRAGAGDPGRSRGHLRCSTCKRGQKHQRRGEEKRRNLQREKEGDCSETALRHAEPCAGEAPGP